ncbi:MAG TPA: acylphosphatase [Dokdonella sp.]
MPAARFFVCGRVQGVCFRASTQARARELGLTGYAANLADGRVEVVACGADDALERLHEWLHGGPPAARVDDVVREASAERSYDDFVRR